MPSACTRVTPRRQHENLHHRQVHPAENDAVYRYAQIQRAKSAQKCRRTSRIADLGELDVGHHSATPPQSRVEKDREHSSGDEAPPQPVPGDPSARHHPGDRQRSVGGEGGCHHRRPGQPPRDVSSREKKLVDAFAGARPVVESDGRIQREVQRDPNPIEPSKCHRLHGPRDLVESARKVRIQALQRRQVRGEQLRRHDVGNGRVQILRWLAWPRRLWNLNQSRRLLVRLAIPRDR